MTTLSIYDYAQSIELYKNYQTTTQQLLPDNEQTLVEQLLQELLHVVTHLGVDDYANYNNSTTSGILLQK